MVRGFYLRFGEGVSEEANRRALALAEALLRAPPPGLLDAVPAYGVLYLEYDPRRLSRGRLLRLLKGLPQERAEEGRVVEIPVRYDGEDLPEVASRLGLSLEAVKALHQKPLYRVYALGFTPGFPFLAEVEPALRLPRKPHPRPRVPAHAVAVAGVQTGIYPLPSPGGWNLLGTSLVAVYDPHRETPFLLRPGDRVRFLEAEGPTPPEPRPLELLPEEPRLPALLVEEPGLMDLVVDGGRFLGGHLGLARSGPLDAPSARLANRLVGNGAGAPLLEFAYKGPVLTALRDLVAAFAGYGFVALLEGEEIPPGQSFLWPRGKTLRFRPRGPGVRGYLAVNNLDKNPRLHVLPTAYGACYAAQRRWDDDDNQWYRITQWAIPFYTMIAASTGDRMALNAFAKRLPAGVTLSTIEIGDWPLYNADVQALGFPDKVQAAQKAMLAADGVVIATPEYNYGISSALKNAIDWLSRPPADSARIFKNRPVAIMGASPGGFGTILSQGAWLPVLSTLGTCFWSGGRLMMSRAHTLVDPDGNITDEAMKVQIAKFMAGFVDFVTCARK